MDPMKPSRWGVEHTFVNSSASGVLSHEFDGAFLLRLQCPRSIGLRCSVVENTVEVNIDHVWKAFRWDELIEVGRH